MPHCAEGLTLPQITKLEGVSDLPMKVRGKFGQALRAEAAGDSETAEQRLLEAIEEEEKLTG